MSFRKSTDLSDNETVVLEARGSEIVDDYGDKRPDSKVMVAGKKVASYIRARGFNAETMGQEKGWVTVFITDK